MKVIGLGAPDHVRVRFDACEMDVLVDVLREQRANATRDAADTYATTPPAQTRPIDDRHARLRAVEGLLMQLEEQPPHNRPGAVLVGDTELMCDVARMAPGKRSGGSRRRASATRTTRPRRRATRCTTPPRRPGHGSRRLPPSTESTGAGTHDATRPPPTQAGE